MEALEALAHPVLLRAFASHIEGPYPHVVVEHLEGPTLRRLIKQNGALPIEQTLPLGLHVASVIHYMAEEGWVHLDLKPDNLVMGIPPRVIDLSLARTIERAQRLTDYIGTNAYMPPEQCNPRGDVGPPADVWGLGATLYHAVAGRLPFRRPRSRDDGAALEDRFPQLEDEPREWRRPVPQPLSDAILSCLEKDPANRPTAGELAMMLQPLVAEFPRSSCSAAADRRNYERCVSFGPLRCFTTMQPHPSTAYLRLSEGPEDLLGAELSLTRRLLTFFVALVLFSGTSLFATAALRPRSRPDREGARGQREGQPRRRRGQLRSGWWWRRRR